MSILSNTKAQFNTMYSKIKTLPVSKGIKNALYEEGLISNSQKKILEKIRDESTNYSNGILAVHGKAGVEYKNTTDANEFINNVSKNIKTATEGSFDKVDDDTARFIKNRASRSPELKKLEKEAIRARSGYIVANGRISPQVIIDEDKATSLIADAARDVDTMLSFKTPIEAAKEYYGTPIMNAWSGFRSEGVKGAVDDGVKAGARIGATALAFGAPVAAISGVGNLTSSLIKGKEDGA